MHKYEFRDVSVQNFVWFQIFSECLKVPSEPVTFLFSEVFSDETYILDVFMSYTFVKCILLLYSYVHRATAMLKEQIQTGFQKIGNLKAKSKE